MPNKLVQQLTSIRGINVECPKCGDSFPISKAKLFSMYETHPPSAHKLMQGRREIARELIEDAKQRTRQLVIDRKRKPEKISISTRATNFGQRCEQIVPAFTTFPYIQGDCRVLLKPVDYVVFDGISTSGRVEAIKFVEFKTGNGTLGLKQRQIRNCVNSGKVLHEVIGQ